MALWKVFPGQNGVYERDFLDNGHVGISYGFKKDLRSFPSRAALHEVQEHGFQHLWRFYDELKTGALVVVPFTNSRIYIGEVAGPYVFREEKAPYHLRPIRWLAVDVPDRKFSRDHLRSFRSPLTVHRVLVASAEERVRDMRWNGIDEYIQRAQEHIESGRLDSEEMEYKLEMIDGLGQARSALFNGDDEWRTLVRKALAVQGSPFAQYSAQVIYNWFVSDPESAMVAMSAFWSEGDVSDAERIQALVKVIPEGQGFKRSAVGTTLRAISALYMALGPDHPPFASTMFESAYRTSHYPRPRRDANQGEVYEHALGFLDRLVERAPVLGFQRPADRLEAQSLVWMMSQETEQEEDTDEQDHESEPDVPDLSALAAELLLPVAFLEKIKELLADQPQIIFQGPPGTGKTYVAKKLAECLAGSPDRVHLVQFHPSYAYEDFVQGYRPTLVEGRASFILRNGPLVELAKLAEGDRDKDFFLVIDEINRGNLAKVFGELYFLLEYRDEAIRLQYSDASFTLPKNLHIIGTMNTADRSIALVDLALRRRFHFVEFHPASPPIKDLLQRWLGQAQSELRWVADVVDLANQKLDNREAAIGPSYFMKRELNADQVELIWEHSVLPYVEEQLYGERERLNEFGLSALRDELGVGAGPDPGAESSVDHDAND